MVSKNIFQVALALVALFCSSDAMNKTRRDVLRKIMEGYDNRISPNFEDGLKDVRRVNVIQVTDGTFTINRGYLVFLDTPTLVTVQIYLVSIDSIQASSMDYKMDIFLRQSWYDDRLKYDPIADVRFLELDVKRMSEIWVPDLFFINEKTGTFHDITIPNRLMHLYASGKVYYSLRVSLTLSCFMHLQKYPFDEQTCPITLESYGFTTENLVFKWSDSPLLRPQTMRMPQFAWKGFGTSDCTKQYGDSNYTCIEIGISLKRNYGYYITQVYVPSVMIVILSWVSFWLDIDAIPARISLGLLTVLTMTTQSSGARASLPHVSYVKAIDVWMAMCLFFVFAGLIEFAYVNVLSRMEKRRMSMFGLTGTDKEENGEGGSMLNKRAIKNAQSRQKARKVDKVSRYLFPCIFLVFNFIYWIVYFIWEPDIELKE